MAEVLQTCSVCGRKGPPEEFGITKCGDCIANNRTKPSTTQVIEWLPGGAQGGAMPEDGTRMLCLIGNFTSLHMMLSAPRGKVVSVLGPGGLKCEWSMVRYYIPASALTPPAI